MNFNTKEALKMLAFVSGMLLILFLLAVFAMWELPPKGFVFLYLRAIPALALLSAIIAGMYGEEEKP